MHRKALLPYTRGAYPVSFFPLLLTETAMCAIVLAMEHTTRWAQIINFSMLAYFYVGFYWFSSSVRKVCAR